ncbi:MAG: FAD-dependent oxidoreductase, partial [Pseudomonadota bacterium]
LNETDVSQLKHDTNGVSIFMETKEEVHSERFDKVLICAGVGSRAMAKALGDQVNVYPVKGYSVTVHLDDHQSRSAAPTVSILDDEAKIVTSRLGADRFRIAGTAEFNGYNRDIRADRIQPLVRWCEQNFPGVSTETVTPWAGLRPMMPNMMPRVGAGRKPGVYYNTGHGHLGWTLSAITAEMVAEAMLADDRRAQPKAIKGKRFSPMRAGERAHG